MTFETFNLLFVDVDHLAVERVQRLLRDDETVRLHTATSPDEALEWAEKNRIDLAVAARRMGEVAGLALLARLREMQPDTLRILVTGYQELSAALMGMSDGLLYRFVLEPWDDEDMQRSIAAALETRRARRDRDASFRRLGGRGVGTSALPVDAAQSLQRLRGVVARVQLHGRALVASLRSASRHCLQEGAVREQQEQLLASLDELASTAAFAHQDVAHRT